MNKGGFHIITDISKLEELINNKSNELITYLEEKNNTENTLEFLRESLPSEANKLFKDINNMNFTEDDSKRLKQYIDAYIRFF